MCNDKYWIARAFDVKTRYYRRVILMLWRGIGGQ